ncbi:MAG: SMR family transporter [Methyloceanibacter sp.]
MPWIYLLTAILFEVAGITSMKLSRGLSEPLPSLAVIVFLSLLLILLRDGSDLSAEAA